MKLGTAHFGDTTSAILIDDQGARRIDQLPGRAEARDVAALIEQPLSADETKLLDSVEKIDLADLRLAPPLLRPPKNVMCVGVNYHAHVGEATEMRSSTSPPVAPCWFTKPATALAGHEGVLPISSESLSIDFEGEVAAVIRARCSGISPDDALEYVFGYTILNDISDRHLQREREQWFLGKALDGSAPCGPWIVTSDEIDDPQQLSIRTIVNGEVRQKASTALMINSFATLIADLSQSVTLEPGDIISGGTPSGVGMADGRYLRAGDEVTVEVERLGMLTTSIRDRQ